MNIKIKILLAFLFVSFLLPKETEAQTKNIWRTLALIKYEKQMDPNDGAAQESRFMPLIKKMDKTVVIVKGYVIPLTGKKAQSHFMFSAYPYANCFFCGKAGPESVMEVFAKDDKEINFSDKSITLKGTFHLLPFYDPNDIMFILKDAELVEE